MTRRGIALLAGIIVVICVAILLVIFVANRSTAPPAKAAGRSGYTAQMAALDIAYVRGQEVRKKMLAHDIRPTLARCVAFYQATVASELSNPELEAQVEAFYVAGCHPPKRGRSSST